MPLLHAPKHLVLLFLGIRTHDIEPCLICRQAAFICRVHCYESPSLSWRPYIISVQSTLVVEVIESVFPLFSLGILHDLGLRADVSECGEFPTWVLTQGPTVGMFMIRHKHGKQGLRDHLCLIHKVSGNSMCTSSDAFSASFAYWLCFSWNASEICCLLVEQQTASIWRRMEIHWQFNNSHVSVTCSFPHEYGFWEM